MSHSIFSPEAKKILENNPYVAHVTRKRISFTAEFKSLFVEKLADGESAYDIIASVGIDPQILGDSRISGMKMYFPNQVGSCSGAYPKPRTAILPKYVAMEKLDRLEHEVKYLKQEQEFIKKILSAAGKE